MRILRSLLAAAACLLAAPSFAAANPTAPDFTLRGADGRNEIGRAHV